MHSLYSYGNSPFLKFLLFVGDDIGLYRLILLQVNKGETKCVFWIVDVCPDAPFAAAPLANLVQVFLAQSKFLLFIGDDTCLCPLIG